MLVGGLQTAIGFEQWLAHGLKSQYDAVLREPLSPELARLLGQADQPVASPS